MSASVMVWTLVAIFASYFVIQDANIVDWLVLNGKMLAVNLRRTWFLIRHNPDFPWVRIGVRINADRNARKLEKELRGKNE